MARYTAEEMREAANAVDDVSINDNCEYFYQKDDKFNPFIVRDMLRQAAGELEREKMYEYKVLYRFNGYLYDSIRHYQDIKSARKVLGVYSGHEDAHIVRRSVGEWEVME